MGKSDSEKTGRSGLGIGLAIFCGILWGAALGGLWYVFEKGEAEFSGGLLHFFARFHILFVHLPIGMIFLVAAMEIFARGKGLEKVRESIPFVLWITLLSGIGATVLGYLLMGVEDVAGRAMDLHLWTGLGVVILTLFALVFKLLHQGIPYFLSLLGTMVCVGAAGHFGGAMVHHPDYLSEHGPDFLKPILLAGLGTREEKVEEINTTPEEAAATEVPTPQRVVYTDMVVPILERSCNECHNENKVKGKLRLDTHELIMAGADGSDFPTVVPGNAEESELIVRVLLDPDDDEFMPPKGEPLTPEEIKLLELWILNGAKPDSTVADLGDSPDIVHVAEAVLNLHSAPAFEDNWEPVWNSLDREEKEARIAQAQADAQRMNISLMPVSAEDSRLQVNVLNGASEFGDEELAALDPVAEHIAWLDLAKSRVTDKGMITVSHMRQLEKLHLQETAVTDAGIALLTPLENLEYLNLYGTGVTDEVFLSFRQMPGLRRIFLWQTKVTESEARAFEKSVNLEVNTGEISTDKQVATDQNPPEGAVN